MLVAFTFPGLVDCGRARPGVRGQVIDARSRTPIANAEVTIVGQRGSVEPARTADSNGPQRVTPPARIRRHLSRTESSAARFTSTTLDDANGVTLLVEAAIAESVDVSGTAPAIDVSAAASTSLVNSRRHRSPASDDGRRDSREHSRASASSPKDSRPRRRFEAWPAAERPSWSMAAVRPPSGEREPTPPFSIRPSSNGWRSPAVLHLSPMAPMPWVASSPCEPVGLTTSARCRCDLPARLAADCRRSAEIWKCRLATGAGAFLPVCVAATSTVMTRPVALCRNSGWRDRGARLRWEHGTGSAAWAVGWQSDLSRDIGRPRSDSDVVRVTTPSEDSHRLTASRTDADRLADSSASGSTGCSALVRQRTDQDRLPASTRPRSLEQSEVQSRELQLRATGGQDVRTRQVPVRRGCRRALRARVHRYRRLLQHGGRDRGHAGDAVDRKREPNQRGRLHAGRRPARAASPSLRWNTGDVVRSANDGGYFGNREVVHSAIAGSASATVMPAASFTLTGQVSRGFREPMLSIASTGDP